MRRLPFITLLISGVVSAQAPSNFAVIHSGSKGYFAEPTTVRIDSTTHVFDYEVNPGTPITILYWCAMTTQGSCTWTAIDGPGASTSGASSTLEMVRLTAIAFGGGIQIFYIDNASGSGKLRRGLYNGSTWTMSTIDGNGGSSGETTHDLDAVGTPGVFTSGGTTWLFVSYIDLTNHTLRVGWTTGSAFTFAELDGAGGANGRITASVGWSSAFVPGTGYLHLFYGDNTNGDMRHAWWSGSGDWSFSTLDGLGQSAATYWVATMPAGVVHGGYMHVFYEDTVGKNIIHAWSSGGGTGIWYIGTHESTGDLYMTLGSVCSDGTNVLVYFGDEGTYDLELSTGTGSSTWTRSIVDGNSSTGGRTTDGLGFVNACAGNDVVYTDFWAGTIRYAY